jgi:hypothetical protein
VEERTRSGVAVGITSKQWCDRHGGIGTCSRQASDSLRLLMGHDVDCCASHGTHQGTESCVLLQFCAHALVRSVRGESTLSHPRISLATIAHLF